MRRYTLIIMSIIFITVCIGGCAATKAVQPDVGPAVAGEMPAEPAEAVAPDEMEVTAEPSEPVEAAEEPLPPEEEAVPAEEVEEAVGAVAVEEEAEVAVEEVVEDVVEARKIFGLIYPVKSFLVSYGDSSDVIRSLTIEIKLALENSDVESEVSEKIPPIRDKVIFTLSGMEVDELLTLGGKKRLKKALIKGINSLLVSGSIADIYFTDFFIE